MEGLLWFDDSETRPVAQKIARAVARYQQKYHHDPDVCYVHPSTLNGQDLSTEAVKVLPARSVLPYHFWVGVIDAKKAKSSGGNI
jgi:hypothetical protein